MRIHPLAALAALPFVAACIDDDNPTSQLRLPTVAVYAPSEGDIPVPNDLLYSGSMDATLNIPVADPMDVSDPLVALNSLDGWSTNAPFVIRFSRDVDMATVVAGVGVRMFEVTTDTSVVPVGGPVTGVTRELTAGTEFSIEAASEYPGTTAIRVVPEALLTPSTLGAPSSYMVVVTSAVQDSSGFAISKDTEYLIASDTTLFSPPQNGTPELAALQGLVLAMETAAEAAGVDRSSIVLSATFTTQSIGAALATTQAIAAGNEMTVISNLCAALPGGCADMTPSMFSNPTGVAGAMSIGTTAVLLGAGPGLADVYVGSLTAPYYLTAGNNPQFANPAVDPTPIQTSWRARYPFVPGDTDQALTRLNPLPEATTAETFPLLITLPNGTSGNTVPAGGWPTVLFLHGIGRNRTDVLAVADALAAAGFATISMDMPMHGLAPSDPLFLGYANGGLRERTFGLDLLDNATFALTPDGVPDASGQWYINLTNLANIRDNLRQSVADLFALKQTIGSFTVGGEALDATQVHFVGQSLGAIVGSVFASLQTDLQSVTLSVPGGGIPYFLNVSPSFAPVIQAGLAANGVLVGTPDYESYVFAAQSVADSGDPINYAAQLQVAGTPVMLHEVIGGGPLGGLPDQVIPNSVPGRPLSGTEPLISALGLTNIITAGANAIPNGVTRFIEGTHGSLLDPSVSPATTTEMQGQVASFLGSGGTTVVVTDTSVIDTTP